MELSELCKKIDLQEEIMKKVLIQKKQLDFIQLTPVIQAFWQPSNWSKSRKDLISRLGPDKDGTKELCCMLFCAAKAYDAYLEKGIHPNLFIDTMQCFTRFIEEYKAMTGEYRFERGWWTVRQISMRLFRIGELEYELIERNKMPAISIHIPSNAKLTSDQCDSSLQRAKQFMSQFFKEYEQADYYCDSWLLSPALSALLPASSRILSFQNRFEIISKKESDMEYIQWVFRTQSRETAAFAEDTRLQKNMKKYLMAGGKIGAAMGMLKKEEHNDRSVLCASCTAQL